MSLSFPLSILFVPYIIFLFIFGFYAFFNLFQLYKHGLKNTETQLLGVGFIVLVAVILAATYLGAQHVNWSEAFTLDFMAP